MRNHTLLLTVAALAMAVAVIPAEPAAAWWLTPVTLSERQPYLGELEVAVSPDGAATAVWISGQTWSGDFDPTMRLWASTRPVGGAWSTPVALGHASWGSPDLAVEASGAPTVVWTSGRMIWAASGSADGAWSAPTPLGELSETGRDPRLVVDASGTATAVWVTGRTWANESSRTSAVWAASRLADGTWSTPTKIGDQGRSRPGPGMAVDPSGTATAVWYGLDGVQASSRPTGGAWSTPVTIGVPAAGLTTGINVIQVASDASGTLTAVWCGGGGPRGYTTEVVASSRPAGGVWSTPTVVGYGLSPQPQLVVGASGFAAVAWSGGGLQPDALISIRPGGGAWSTPTTPGDPTESVGSVAVDANGTVIAVWTTWATTTDGGNSWVRASSRPAGGAWTAPTTLSDPARPAGSPRLALDASGTATAIWLRTDGADRSRSVPWVEAVRFGLPLPLSPPTAPATTRPAKAVILTRSARLDRRGRVGLAIRCIGGPCRGELTLTVAKRTSTGKPRTVEIGRTPFRIPSAGTRTISVRISTAGRKLVRRAGRSATRATVSVRLGPRTMPSAVASRRVDLRPSAPRRR